MVNSPSEILALTNEAAILVRHGRVQYANPCACGIFGSECIGQTVRDLFGQEIAGTQARSFVCGFCLKKTQYVLRVSPVDDSQIFFLSPREAAEGYMNDAFLFSLRSCLSGFGMAAEQARELTETQGGAINRCLNTMTHSYYRIARMIRNITVVRNAASDELAKEIRIFDLADVCRCAVDTVSSIRRDECIVFGFEGSMPVRGDPYLIELMLANLISNSIVHARGHRRIFVNMVDAGDSVILSVSDDGCGIPPEQLPKVFSRYRWIFELCEMGCGSGFGLSAALAVAERHGGTLLLESRSGSGTAVRASLKKGNPDTMHSRPEELCGSMTDILADYADCLPDDCYSAKYLD